jgi:hypothetical protein
MRWLGEKFLALPRIERGRPARNQSLFRLCCSTSCACVVVEVVFVLGASNLKHIRKWNRSAGELLILYDITYHFCLHSLRKYTKRVLQSKKNTRTQKCFGLREVHQHKSASIKGKYTNTKVLQSKRNTRTQKCFNIREVHKHKCSSL